MSKIVALCIITWYSYPEEVRNRKHLEVSSRHAGGSQKYSLDLLEMVQKCTVVPHKAAAELSKIGNL
jgi:hypothetical protein